MFRHIKRKGNISNSKIYLYTENPEYIVLSNGRSSMFLLTKNKDDVDKIFANIHENFKNINGITMDFDLILKEIISGREFSHGILKMKNFVSSIKNAIPKNEFEKAVIKDLSEISSGILSNISIEFTEPNEIFEYDILFPINENKIINIEIKDYESVKEGIRTSNNLDTLKSKIILSPLDKATRLGAELIVIIKGLDEERFKQINILAKSRKVLLFNENEYKHKLETILIERLFKSDIKPMRNPSFLRRF